MNAPEVKSVFDVDPLLRIAIISCEARDEAGNLQTAEQVAAANPALRDFEILPMAGNRALYAEAMHRSIREQANAGIVSLISNAAEGAIMVGTQGAKGWTVERHRVLVLHLSPDKMRFAYVFAKHGVEGKAFRSFVGFMPGGAC